MIEWLVESLNQMATDDSLALEYWSCMFNILSTAAEGKSYMHKVN